MKLNQKILAPLTPIVIKMYVINNLKQNMYAATNVCFIAVPRIENQ